jgi:Tfp pilus assembly protein PilV
MRVPVPKHCNETSGFTFTETLVAVLTGAVMLAALYSSFGFGYGAVKLAREDLRATQILVEQMEALRLTSFSAIQNSTLTNYFDPTGITNGTAGAVYTITLTTNAPTASDMPVQPVYYMSKMRKVTVTATWTNANQLRTRSLITYATQTGIQNYIYAHQ